MRRERTKCLVVDRSVRLEGRADRGQDLTEHVRESYRQGGQAPMIREFRDFLMRGNLVDLAVAFVMGVVFAGLVGSFVSSFVMPFIAMIIGEPDFSGLTFTINDAVFTYGAFITAAITFFTTAAAIFFLVVTPIDALRARVAPIEEAGPNDEERRHQELLAALERLGR